VEFVFLTHSFVLFVSCVHASYKLPLPASW
jgi:hypothetical protein